MLLAIVKSFRAAEVTTTVVAPAVTAAQPVGTAPVEAWLSLLLLGGVAGMLGQGARAIVGLKKAHDAADSSGVDFAAVLDPGRLFVSFAIGFVAGALAALELNRVGG